MNLPTSVVITGCESMEDLEQALTAARTFEPLTEDQVKNLLSQNGPGCIAWRVRVIQDHPSTTAPPPSRVAGRRTTRSATRNASVICIVRRAIGYSI